MFQDDWAGWAALTGSTDIQIVGDDLTVTNPKRIQVKISFKNLQLKLETIKVADIQSFILKHVTSL